MEVPAIGPFHWASLTGYLVLGGSRLYFAYTEVRAGPVLTFKAAGTRGGSAAAEGNVSPSADPAATLQACASGGLTQAPVDLRLATTPAMSG